MPQNQNRKYLVELADHFRQRFNAEFIIKSERKGERYWYKHQWAMDGGTPYLIEVAIAETEIAGGVFYLG